MKKGLEFILKGAASIIVLLGINQTVKAETLSIMKKDAPEIVTFSADEIRNTKISKDFILWEEDNNIWYVHTTDPNTQYQLTTSGNANNPDLDENLAVYEESGSIFRHDLETGEKKLIYESIPDETCQEPKIKGEHLIFGVEKTSGLESWIEIWECEHDRRRPSFKVLTNSRSPKKSHDTNGRYVVWAELNEKEGSRPDLMNGDYDVRIYDLETGKPSIFDSEIGEEIFFIDDSNNFSSDSCVLNDRYIAYNCNTLDPHNLATGPTASTTFLKVFYLEDGRVGKRRSTKSGPNGSCHELDLCGDLFTWSRKYGLKDGVPSEPDRIEYIIIMDEESQGFRLYDGGGPQHSPNAYLNSDGSIAMIAYVTDANNPEHEELSLSSASTPSGEMLPAGMPPPLKDTLYTTSLEEITHPILILKEFSASYLTNSTFDYNQNNFTNLKDFATLANKLGM